MSDIQTSGAALLFSLRHDFPSEWSLFAAGGAQLQVSIAKSLFPYLVADRTVTITKLELYATTGKEGKQKLIQRTAAVPAGDLDDGPTTLVLEPDATVLKRDAADVFLVVRYTFED